MMFPSLPCMLFLFGWLPCQRSDMTLVEVSQRTYNHLCVRDLWLFVYSWKLCKPDMVPVSTFVSTSLCTQPFIQEQIKEIIKAPPIYKKENKLLMDNYRPISLLSSMSKLFEKVVYNQLISRKIAFSTMANTVFEWITAPNSRRSNL